MQLKQQNTATMTSPERALLGSLLAFGAKAWPLVAAAGLTADHFAADGRDLFAAIRTIAEVDPLRVDDHAVTTEMHRRGAVISSTLLQDLHDVGGPTIDYVPSQIEAVIEASAQRRAALLLTDAAAHLPTVSPGKVGLYLENVRDSIGGIIPKDAKQSGFDITPARALADMVPPPREDILGDALLFPRGLTALIAPPGTGKTRLAIQLAVSSLIGRPLGPLAMPRRSLKWLLLIGNENSLRRCKVDLTAQLLSVPAEYADTVLDSIGFQLVEDVDDVIGPQSFGKISKTCEAFSADVVIFDPLGDLLSGDSNSDSDTRESLRSIQHSVWSARPTAAILLIHHAREGRNNTAMAVGWDKGAYGKGSKAIRAACRAVLNVAPGDADNGDKIVVACGKCNDAQPFEPFGLELVNGIYEWDRCFDLEAWAADVEGKRSKNSLNARDVVDYLAGLCLGAATQAQIAAHFSVDKGTVSRFFNKDANAAFFKAFKQAGITYYKSAGKLTPRKSTARYGADEETF